MMFLFLTILKLFLIICNLTNLLIFQLTTKLKIKPNLNYTTLLFVQDKLCQKLL